MISNAEERVAPLNEEGNEVAVEQNEIPENLIDIKAMRHMSVIDIPKPLAAGAVEHKSEGEEIAEKKPEKLSIEKKEIKEYVPKEE